MSCLDWLFIGLYFLLLLGITWWVIRRGQDTAADYFLASRNLGWFIVGASIFASNIGSEHLVGVAGAGATSGVALAHFQRARPDRADAPERLGPHVRIHRDLHDDLGTRGGRGRYRRPAAGDRRESSAAG